MLVGFVMQYIVKMRKKRDILINFLAWKKKITKTYEVGFSNMRKNERKAKIGVTVREIRSRTTVSQMQADCFMGKNQTLRIGKF